MEDAGTTGQRETPTILLPGQTSLKPFTCYVDLKRCSSQLLG